MREFAIMLNAHELIPGTGVFDGSVLTIVMTSRSLEQVQESELTCGGKHKVVPIGKVSQRALINYRYWGERP